MKRTKVEDLMIKTSAFDDENFISSRYASRGKKINPPLEISCIPEQTKKLALIVEDPDAPHGVFDHWLV